MKDLSPWAVDGDVGMLIAWVAVAFADRSEPGAEGETGAGSEGARASVAHSGSAPIATEATTAGAPF